MTLRVRLWLPLVPQDTEHWPQLLQRESTQGSGHSCALHERVCCFWQCLPPYEGRFTPRSFLVCLPLAPQEWLHVDHAPHWCTQSSGHKCWLQSRCSVQ